MKNRKKLIGLSIIAVVVIASLVAIACDQWLGSGDGGGASSGGNSGGTYYLTGNNNATLRDQEGNFLTATIYGNKMILTGNGTVEFTRQ